MDFRFRGGDAGATAGTVSGIARNAAEETSAQNSRSWGKAGMKGQNRLDQNQKRCRL